MSTKNCDDCRFFVANRPRGSTEVCSRGHSPRFYTPKSPVDTDWGYRRDCDDFKPVKPQTE